MMAHEWFALAKTEAAPAAVTLTFRRVTSRPGRFIRRRRPVEAPESRRPENRLMRFRFDVEASADRWLMLPTVISSYATALLLLVPYVNLLSPRSAFWYELPVWFSAVTFWPQWVWSLILGAATSSFMVARHHNNDCQMAATIRILGAVWFAFSALIFFAGALTLGVVLCPLLAWNCLILHLCYRLRCRTREAADARNGATHYES